MAIDPIDRRHSPNRCRVTDLTETTRRYAMSVHVPGLRLTSDYIAEPWITVTADLVTEDIRLAADLGIRRVGRAREDVEDDGT